MRIIEIDTGSKINEYEYIDEDIDTYLVSSDEIDLSHEGFLFKQVKYDNSIVEKKCKLVKKETVDRHYADWTETYIYYCGIRCWYEEMGDHIRIFTGDVPKKLRKIFKYEEFYIEGPGQQALATKTHHYYKDVSYSDKKLQIKVIKKHQDYMVDMHGVTADTNDEERENLIVEYLIKRVSKSLVDCDERISSLLYGSYGYRIPDQLYSTNLDLIFDKVLPDAYRLCAAGGPYAGPTFLRDLKRIIVNGYWGNSVHYKPKQLWIEDGKAVYPSEEYAVFMMIQFHLKLMEKLKKQEYPYTLMELKNISYCLAGIDKKYLENHNKVYWNGKVVCDDLGSYIEKSLEELVYFIQFE